MYHSVLAISKQLSGSVKASENFYYNEFACKDGTDTFFISEELINILQEIRDYFKSPVVITSGYRTPTHNSSVGGVYNSKHLRGLACDFVVQNVSTDDVLAFLEMEYPTTPLGIGTYGTFTHLDLRYSRHLWKG